MKEVGEITHYFSGINVAAIKLKDTLKEGDKIRIKGATTDFEQAVDSIEIDRKEVEKANSGDEIGIKSKKRVREGDVVYKLE